MVRTWMFNKFIESAVQIKAKGDEDALLSAHFHLSQRSYRSLM